MVNNVVLVSGVQQSDSVIYICVYIYIYIYIYIHIYTHTHTHTHTHVSILFQIFFPFRLLHNIEQTFRKVLSAVERTFSFEPPEEYG